MSDRAENILFTVGAVIGTVVMAAIGAGVVWAYADARGATYFNIFTAFLAVTALNVALGALVSAFMTGAKVKRVLREAEQTYRRPLS